MDRNVTVRFYEIDHRNPTAPVMEAALRTLNARSKRDREEDVGDEVVLRLEHLEEQDGLFLGDVTRVQSHNLPGHVVENTLNRLPVDRIGHSTAFLYDPATRCMAFQFDMRTGIGRLCRYFRQALPGADFGYLPYLKRDTLERFRNQTPRKLRLRVSRIRNFQDIPQGKTDFEDQIEEWAHFFDAPSIEIILSTRGEGRSLDNAGVWNTIRRWISFREQIEGIKNIEAETIESDEAFNFIKDLLYETDTLNLPDNDPVASRGVRLRYVRECYDEHRDYIAGAAGGP